MAFHWSLSDSKSPQVSRTCLRILAVPSNAVVWIVSTRRPTSKSSRPFNYYNWHNRYFHVPQPFQLSSKFEVLILLFTFFQIYSVVHRDSKVDNFANSLFFIIIIMRSDLYYYYYYYFESFSHQRKRMGFHWSLSYTKSLEVCRTLLSVLADLYNAILCMVFSRPLISKSSNPCTKNVVTVRSTPITIGLTVAFMFHSDFSMSLAMSRYISLFSLSCNFAFCSVGTTKSSIRQVLFSCFFFVVVDLFVFFFLLFFNYHEVWLAGRD